MKFNNPEHIHEVPTNIGTVTFIQTIRKNRPQGLKKPYEYILPVKQAKALYDELNDYLKLKINYQCAGISRKNITKGIRFNLFLLGYTEGLCGRGSKVNVTEIDWLETCKHIQMILIKYLGKDATIYADRYCTTDKFQCRFETYIAYKELL